MNARSVSRYLRMRFGVVAQPEHKYIHEGFSVSGSRWDDQATIVVKFGPDRMAFEARQLVKRMREDGVYRVEHNEGSPFIYLTKNPG